MAANILEIRDLVDVVSRHTIIDHLDFAIEEGELRVLVGPNGAGKTTLIDLITGRHRPTAGQILFKGERIDGRARHEIYRLGISRKFQVPTVYDNLTVFENMSIGLRGHRSVFSSLGYRITPAAAEQIERILAEINLLERARDEAASPIVLSPGSPAPSLRLDSGGGQLLLQISGLDGVSNTITNPAALGSDVAVRLVISGGSTGTVLPASRLRFQDRLRGGWGWHFAARHGGLTHQWFGHNHRLLSGSEPSARVWRASTSAKPSRPARPSEGGNRQSISRALSR